MSLRRLVAPVLVVLLAAVPGTARAQAARLIGDARQQIEDLNWDSAATLLNQALRGTATPAERARAFTLLAITQLSKGDRGGARSAFEQALRIDATLRVDSLADLHSDVRLVFGEERTALGISDPPRAGEGTPRLALTLDTPPDTILPAADGGLRIETRPSYRARVVTAITPADQPGLIVWNDTGMASGIHTAVWNLRGRDGSLVAPGRYILRASATDSVGQVSPTVERILQVSREVGDTTSEPPALDPSAFAPETLRLRRGSPGSLAAGFAIAAAAAMAPSAMGNAGLRSGASNTGAYAVAGVVSIASVVGFLRGTRDQQMPANVLLNQRLRQRHADERRRIAEANARQRESAPVRVRLEGAGP